MSNAVGAPILEQPTAIEFNRQSGNIVTRRWVGLNNAVLAEASIQSLYADNLQFESHGAAASLTARYGTPQDGSEEILITQFEMRGEEITQSIWKHPIYSAISKTTQKVIKTAVDSEDSYSVSLGKIHPSAVANGDNTTHCDNAFDLLIEGTDNYLVDQSYVFIRTRTGSRNYQAVLEFTGDGKIWSSGQVATYVGDPAPFNVPSLSAVANSQALQLAYGWRKRPTDVTRISNGNQQITESWQSARWTMLLYTAMT